MPFLTIVALTGIVSMFGAFIIGLGGVQLWLFLGERRDRRAARTQAAGADEAEWLKAA